MRSQKTSFIKKNLEGPGMEFFRKHLDWIRENGIRYFGVTNQSLIYLDQAVTIYKTTNWQKVQSGISKSHCRAWRRQPKDMGMFFSIWCWASDKSWGCRDYPGIESSVLANN